jgi:hypothetical protein
MNKIKERMFNVEKGKSVEIKESKRAKQLRLEKERQDDLHHEGGEDENSQEDQKLTPEGDKESDKEVSPVKDQPQQQLDFEFDEQAEEKGDQVLNLSNVPKDLSEEINQEKKGLGR